MRQAKRSASLFPAVNHMGAARSTAPDPAMIAVLDVAAIAAERCARVRDLVDAPCPAALRAVTSAYERALRVDFRGH